MKTGCYERRFVERENPSGGHDRGSGGCLCAVAAQRCGICRLVSFARLEVDITNSLSGMREEGDRNHIGLRCFACGEGGDLFAFVQKIEGCSFTEAMGKLAKRYSIDSREWTVDNYAGKKKRTDGKGTTGKRTAGSSDKTANENSDDQLSVVNSQLSIVSYFPGMQSSVRTLHVDFG